MLDSGFVNAFWKMAEDATAPKTVEIHGQSYYKDAETGELRAVGEQAVADPERLCLGTLSGLHRYLNSEGFVAEDGMVVHVDSPRVVRVVGRPDPTTGSRPVPVTATCDPVAFDLASQNRPAFKPQDEFIIMLQTHFHPSDQLSELVAATGTVKFEEGIQLEDNGITQKVSKGSGVSLLEKTSIKPIWKLRPIVSFPDLYASGQFRPVDVPFLLRLEKNGSLALVVADGGAWAPEVMEQIRDSLELMVPEGLPVVS